MFYGFAAYTTITLIMSYLEYDTSTLVSSIFEAPSTFPKITICNLNQFTTQFAYEFIQKMDKMNATKSIRSLAGHSSCEGGCNVQVGR